MADKAWLVNMDLILCKLSLIFSVLDPLQYAVRLPHHPQDQHARWIAIAPQMHIQPVFPIVHGDGFSVPDHSGHHAQDVFIFDVSFQESIVVPGNKMHFPISKSYLLIFCFIYSHYSIQILHPNHLFIVHQSIICYR